MAVLSASLCVLPAGATSESGSIPPPVIRETFTPLPCPSDPAARQTTSGSLACLQHRILRTDARINRRVKAIFGKLHDEAAKRRFALAERSWLTYRRTSCTSVADVLRGGSAQPVLFARCVVDRNVEHLKSLAQFWDLARRR